jgi:hypothetical protein
MALLQVVSVKEETEVRARGFKPEGGRPDSDTQWMYPLEADHTLGNVTQYFLSRCNMALAIRSTAGPRTSAPSHSDPHPKMDLGSFI